MSSTYYHEFLDLIPYRITKKLQSLDNIELLSFVKIHKNCCLSNKFRRFWLSLKISFNTVYLSLLYKGHLNKKWNSSSTLPELHNWQTHLLLSNLIYCPDSLLSFSYLPVSMSKLCALILNLHKICLHWNFLIF
jgi:hypothetical protein